MEKLYYVLGGWIAFNVIVVIALSNRRPVPHARHRLERWVMGTPRSSRRQRSFAGKDRALSRPLK